MLIGDRCLSVLFCCWHVHILCGCGCLILRAGAVSARFARILLVKKHLCFVKCMFLHFLYIYITVFCVCVSFIVWDLLAVRFLGQIAVHSSMISYCFCLRFVLSNSSKGEGHSDITSLALVFKCLSVSVLCVCFMFFHSSVYLVKLVSLGLIRCFGAMVPCYDIMHQCGHGSIY